MSPTAYDITGENRIDRRTTVRRREDYFWLKRLADVSGEACLVVNRNMIIEYADEKLFDLLGIDPEEGSQFTQFADVASVMARHGYFGPGNPKMFEALISDLLVNQRLKQNSATQIINTFTPDGRHIDIRVSLGRDGGFLVLMRDNTRTQLKKIALDTALQIGRSGYWFYNLHTGEFNLRADSLKPYFSDETFQSIMTGGFLDLLHEDDRDAANRAIDDSINSSVSNDILLRCVGEDGTVLWLNSHIMPNVDENGKVRSLSCFFTDISSQVETRKAVEDAKENAERALHAKNEFLARLSHEVRTPMNAVVGMADALVRSHSDTALTSQLSLILNSAEKVVSLVDGTLEHTKLRDNAIELDVNEHSPGEIVRSACSKWQGKASQDNTRLTCVIKDTVPDSFQMDDFRFEQCVNNLVSNALKFSKGGVVQVVLTTAERGGGNQLVLAVRDNGIGMDKQVLDHVFLPFKQADKTISSRFGGTGLGLSIVRDLVGLMGGKVTVSSEPGKGSLFMIFLPMQSVPAMHEAKLQIAEVAPEPMSNAQTVDEEPIQAVATEPATVPPPPAAEDTPYSNLDILIVDDNATNHIVISSLLSSVVGQITTALNGQEAIDKLKSKRFDLVLMDIHMPVMDGIEATIAIRSSEDVYSDVPIIALTADPQYQQARLCRNIGMNAALAKPIKLTGLLQAFDDVLEARRKSRVSSAA